MLFHNRADAFEHPGGDTTQMNATRDALIKLGVDVEISLDESPDLAGYDLVHIFNIQTAERSLRQLRNAYKQGVPVVVSTIYWDMRYVTSSDDALRYSPGFITRILYRAHPALSRLYYYIRSYPIRRRIFDASYKILMEANLLLPNSYAELEIVSQVFRLPIVRGKALVVPNGVDPGEWQDGSVSDEDVPDLPSEYVLQVASYGYGKGQRQLIRAMMDSRDVPLVFVGFGPDSEYGQDCRKLGDVRGNTYFLEFMPHDRLKLVYRRARVHVLTSMRESPGLTTLEAAANGANCVVSIHAPVGEYFGDDAWVCDPSDVDSIKRAVHAAWDAPRDVRLRDRVLANFTWDKAAETTLQGYERVLKSRTL